MKYILVNTIVLPIILNLGITLFVVAEEEHEHRHHEAHVHGEAELSFIIDENAIVFELKSPALNILGFEHKPKTDFEKEKVETANKLLSNYQNIIDITEIACRVNESTIESPYSHGNKHEAEHDHDHGHHHHDEEHHDEVEHEDYYLSYSLNCDNIDDLKTIEVILFDNFNGFETIEALWIYQNESGSSELTKNNKTLKIK